VIIRELFDFCNIMKKSGTIENNWELENKIQSVQISILNLSTFLSDFEASIKNKLGELNSKLNHLERIVEYCEHSLSIEAV